MMTVPYEKIEKKPKTSKVLFEKVIDGFERDPRHLQLLFLSDADKSC